MTGNGSRSYHLEVLHAQIRSWPLSLRIRLASLSLSLLRRRGRDPFFAVSGPNIHSIGLETVRESKPGQVLRRERARRVSEVRDASASQHPFSTSRASHTTSTTSSAPCSCSGPWGLVLLFLDVDSFPRLPSAMRRLRLSLRPPRPVNGHQTPFGLA